MSCAGLRVQIGGLFALAIRLSRCYNLTETPPEIDWQAASDAVSGAEAELVAVLKDFRRTGDEERVRSALLVRMSASAKLRALMQMVWAAPI
jgi:hypothetical protein